MLIMTLCDLWGPTGGGVRGTYGGSHNKHRHTLLFVGDRYFFRSDCHYSTDPHQDQCDTIYSMVDRHGGDTVSVNNLIHKYLKFTHTRVHTHTHIYIHICMCVSPRVSVCVCVCVLSH